MLSYGMPPSPPRLTLALLALGWQLHTASNTAYSRTPTPQQHCKKRYVLPALGVTLCGLAAAVRHQPSAQPSEKRSPATTTPPQVAKPCPIPAAEPATEAASLASEAQPPSILLVAGLLPMLLRQHPPADLSAADKAYLQRHYQQLAQQHLPQAVSVALFDLPPFQARLQLLALQRHSSLTPALTLYTTAPSVRASLAPYWQQAPTAEALYKALQQARKGFGKAQELEEALQYKQASPLHRQAEAQLTNCFLTLLSPEDLQAAQQHWRATLLEQAATEQLRKALSPAACQAIEAGLKQHFQSLLATAIEEAVYAVYLRRLAEAAATPSELQQEQASLLAYLQRRSPKLAWQLHLYCLYHVAKRPRQFVKRMLKPLLEETFTAAVLAHLCSPQAPLT